MVRDLEDQNYRVYVSNCRDTSPEITGGDGKDIEIVGDFFSNKMIMLSTQYKDEPRGRTYIRMRYGIIEACNDLGNPKPKWRKIS
jgi:hypothetical protein